MLKYQLFPRSVGITEQIQHIIECSIQQIKSPENELKSNEVLDILRPQNTSDSQSKLEKQ